MLVKVISRVKGGNAEVRGIHEAPTFDEAVRHAFRNRAKFSRIDRCTQPARLWTVTGIAAGNRTYRIDVWCERATEADVAKYGAPVKV